MDLDFKPVEPHATLPHSISFLSDFDILVVDTEDGLITGKHYTVWVEVIAVLIFQYYRAMPSYLTWSCMEAKYISVPSVWPILSSLLFLQMQNSSHSKVLSSVRSK